MQVAGTLNVGWVTTDLTTGAEADADATPTAILRRNGAVVGAAAITVGALTGGEYQAAVLLDAAHGWTTGDEYRLTASWAMGGAAKKQIIAQGSIAVTADNASIADILEDTGTTLPAQLAVILEDTGTTLAAQLADILTDTGTTLPAQLAVILEDTGTTLPEQITDISGGGGEATDITALESQMSQLTANMLTLTTRFTQLENVITAHSREVSGGHVPQPDLLPAGTAVKIVNHVTYANRVGTIYGTMLGDKYVIRLVDGTTVTGISREFILVR